MRRIKVKKSSIYNLLQSVMFFLIIFNPPFLPILSFTIIFTLVSIIYCFVFERDAIAMIMNPCIRRWLKIFIVFYVYYCMVSVISMTGNSWPTNPIEIFMRSMVSVISLFFVPAFLCLTVFRRGRGVEELTELIINAGVIEALFGIAAFINPGVKSFLNGITIANSKSAVIRAAVSNAFFRNYGIASTLFDTFGFGMSIIALITLHKALAGKSKYFLFFLMITFVACINARTSMVLIAGGAAIIIFSKAERTRKVAITKSIIILTALFFLITVKTYLDSGNANAQWISMGIGEIKALMVGREKTGIFLTLSKELYIPDNPFHIIFGTGLTPEQAILKTSDVGYIQNLWSFGVVGSLLLYFFYFYPLWQWRKKREEKKLALAIMAAVFIFFIKLNLWGYGISAVVLMPILMGRLYTLNNKSVEGKKSMISQRSIMMNKKVLCGWHK